MVIRRLFALLFALLPLAVHAAASTVALTPLQVSVEGGQSRVFSARFYNADNTPSVNETVTWANDVCGTFPNGSSQASGTTDASGTATITFTAAPSAGITCWLTATAGRASAQFNVVTYRLDQVTLAADTTTLPDANGTVDIRTSVMLGMVRLPEVAIEGRLVSGVGDFSGSGGSGQSGIAEFLMQPPIGATRGEWEMEFAFRGITKSVTYRRGPLQPGNTLISGPAPGGGTNTLTVASSSPTCGFSATSSLLDPAVTDFLPEYQPSRGLTYAEGLVSVRTTNCGVGETLTFTLTTPRPIPAGSLFWMLSATPDNPVRRWHPVPVTVVGNAAIFKLTDGVDDEDQAADGSILFFGGLALGPPWYFDLQDLWWGGTGENGWGVSIVQHQERLFAVIYAYDANGMPTWYVMSGGQWNAARTAFTGAVYSPRGAPYTQYDASRLDVGPPVGTMTLTFLDASHANLDYTINGMASRKQITRQPFGPVAGGARPAVGDMWWGGSAQSGWGIAILQQYGSLFGVWFTYNDAGEPTWFVMPAGTWSNPDTYEGRIYRTSGARWLAMSYNAAAFRVNDVGSFRIEFPTADSAVFQWNIDGRSGTLQLQRQAF